MPAPISHRHSRFSKVFLSPGALSVYTAESVSVYFRQSSYPNVLAIFICVLLFVSQFPPVTGCQSALTCNGGQLRADMRQIAHTQSMR